MAVSCSFDELAAPVHGYMAMERPPLAPGPPAGYCSASTWENRYEEQEGTFDWYVTYRELRPVFEEFSPPDEECAVLQLGCGNSALSAEMHEAGYRRVMNIDISESAVKKMEETYARLGMEWLVMDATAMSFEDNRFHLAVDKGTLDAMMHGGSEGQDLAAGMTADVWRTLRPGGVFLLVSHNGLRQQQVLDGALTVKLGPSARWNLLELRKVALSPQAMLINILRSKLKGRPIMEGFRDPEMLKEAAAETKFALKQMQFLEAFRLFKAKKVQQRIEAGLPVEEPAKKPAAAAEDDSEDEVSRDPRRQPYCWVYILQKPL